MVPRLLLVCLVMGCAPSTWAQCTKAQIQNCKDVCSIFSGGKHVVCVNVCEAGCSSPPPPPPPLVVSISDGPEVTADDIAQFDAKWMQPFDRGWALDGARCGLFRRDPAAAWGTEDRMAAMVRMYELTHQMRYLDHLHDLIEAALQYRDDNYDPGNGPPDPLCCPTTPSPKKPIDYLRGQNEPAWAGWMYDNVGYAWADEDASNLYGYGIAAFARIVAEDQPVNTPAAAGKIVRPSLQAKYGDDALRYTNAVLQTAWAFVPQLQIRNAGNLFEAYLTQLDILTTKPSASDIQTFYNLKKSMFDAANAQAVGLGEPKLYGDASYSRLKQQQSNYNNFTCIAGAPLAHNESGLYAMMLIELWRVLDSGFYRLSSQQASTADLSRTLFPILISRFHRYFADELQTVTDPNGVRFFWHYQDDQPSCIKNIDAEDTEHGMLDMRYVGLLSATSQRLYAQAAALGEPIPLDQVQLQRFANTFLEEIGPGAHFNHFVDGTPSSPDENGVWEDDARCDGWVNLAAANPKVYRVCREVALRVVPGTVPQPNLNIANHSALLMNKRFNR
jgi:hypothetical protein